MSETKSYSVKCKNCGGDWVTSAPTSGEDRYIDCLICGGVVDRRPKPMLVTKEDNDQIARDAEMEMGVYPGYLDRECSD